MKIEGLSGKRYSRIQFAGGILRMRFQRYERTRILASIQIIRDVQYACFLRKSSLPMGEIHIKEKVPSRSAVPQLRRLNEIMKAVRVMENHE